MVMKLFELHLLTTFSPWIPCGYWLIPNPVLFFSLGPFSHTNNPLSWFLSPSNHDADGETQTWTWMEDMKAKGVNRVNEGNSPKEKMGQGMLSQDVEASMNLWANYFIRCPSNKFLHSIIANHWRSSGNQCLSISPSLHHNNFAAEAHKHKWWRKISFTILWCLYLLYPHDEKGHGMERKREGVG